MFHGGMNPAVPLLHVTRGDLLESVHRGAFIVIEGERTILQRGDPSWVVYYRSTSKPIQALVGVTSGAADAFGLNPAELALAAGSHSTRPEHLALVQSILEKTGVPESALACGGHYAFDPEIGRRQRQERAVPQPIWSNCSGEHALTLAAAKHLGLPLESYLDPSHPVQVEVRRHVALLCGLDVGQVAVGIDGCNAPAFAVPLDAMARSLARFGAPHDLPDDLAEAARRITSAMNAYPEMVGGPGRFDTDLMASSSEVLLAKAGAEGVHGVIAPARALGMAIKVEDGHDRGYRLVVLALLEQLGLLSSEEARGIRSRQCDPVIRTRSGEAVGRLEVVLD